MSKNTEKQAATRMICRARTRNRMIEAPAALVLGLSDDHGMLSRSTGRIEVNESTRMTYGGTERSAASWLPRTARTCCPNVPI